MRTGHKAAAAEQWSDAWDAYADAFVMKQSPAAKEALEGAKGKAVDSELELARKALIRDEYPEAKTHLDTVDKMDPDNPDSAERRRAVRTEMIADIRGQIDGEADLRVTYELVGDFREMYPADDERTKLLFDQHYKVEDISKALVEAEQYKQAVEAARLLGEFDPGQATRSEVLEREIGVLWADQYADRAKTESKAKRYGLAGVLHMRAYELSDREADRSAGNTAIEREMAQARVHFLLDSEGDGRHWMLSKILRNQIEQHPDVKRGGTQTWTLKAKLYASKQWCNQTSEKETLTKDWISGTKQVSNPEYETIDAELDAAKAELKTAESDLKKKTPGAERADTSMAKLDGTRTAASEAFAAIEEKYANSQKQQKDVLANEAELVAAVERLEKSGTDQEVAVANGSLKTVRKYVEKAAATLEEDKAEYDKLKAELGGVDASQANARSAATASQKEREAATAAATAASEEVASIESRLSEHTETLPEDVPAVLEYDKTTWLLSCQGPTTLYTTAKWETALEKKTKTEVTKSATDTSHRGHSGAALKEDPREYPKSREVMYEEINDETLAGISEHLIAHVKEYYSLRLAGGLEALGGDPDQATQELTALLLGAGGVADDEVKTQVKKHLADTYGLADPGLLTPTTPP